MKGAIITFVAALSCLSCLGEASSKHEIVIGTNRIEVVWNVPASNTLPSIVWVYKIIPQNFSTAVVSNLMALGPFTMADRTNIVGQPPFKDKRLLYFRDKSGRKELGIFPPIGWIYFKDRNAEPKKKEVSTVPDDQKTLELGLQYVKRFGIDRSQLATKADGSQLKIVRDVGKRGHVASGSEDQTEEVINRGIFFIRRSDGIDFDGIGTRGGVYLNLGNDNKLARLEIVWKGIEPLHLYKTLAAKEIVSLIQSGKTKWDRSMPDWSSVKQITITDCVPYYRGVLGDDVEQKVIEPYAELAVTVDNNDTARLECPILGDRLKP
jgi:hypothetical protein